MIIDLHSHYFPVDMLRTLEDPPVRVEQISEASFRVSTGEQRVPVDSRLFDLRVQLDDMRAQGIDKRVLMVPPFVMLYELSRHDGALWAQSLNDAIADAVHSKPDALIGLATVPLQNIDATLSELERVATELHLKGIQIATSVNGVGLDEPALDPFWSKCEELGLLILVHPHYVSGESRMGGFHLRNLVGNPAETALAGARILFAGVLERFPGLRIILSHGGGALPHLVGRLAHGFKVRPECRERAAEPIATLKRFYFDTIVFDPVVLRHLVEHVGTSQVVLGTDYPFDMAEDDPIGFIRRSGLPEHDQEAVLSVAERLVSNAPVAR